jgi:hypothetical protein
VSENERIEIVRRPGPGRQRARPQGVPAAQLLPSGVVARAAPGLARVAAMQAWQVMSWSLGAGVASANYLARRTMNGAAATTILHEAATELRSAAWQALGLTDRYPGRPASGRGQPGWAPRASAAELQRRGADLMRRANDVHVVEDTHPAFARILSEITPDEGRILRFLCLDGPQPALDVRTFRPFGIGSVLIAGGLSMIAEHAGCRYLDRIDPYLTNLARLGLIEFSKEQVSDPSCYQVIEAQPKVADALKRAGRMPKMIQRSIHLNCFGRQFCRACLPLTGLTRPSPRLPRDSAPGPRPC